MDLRIRTDSGSPATAVIVFAFWYVRPEFHRSCETVRGDLRGDTPAAAMKLRRAA